MPSRRTARRNRRTARRNRKTARRFPPYGPRRRKNRRIQRGGVWNQTQKNNFRDLMNNVNTLLQEHPEQRQTVIAWWTAQLSHLQEEAWWITYESDTDPDYIFSLPNEIQANPALVSELYNLWHFVAHNDDGEDETREHFINGLRDAELSGF